MYDFCENHPDRVKHFYDHDTKTICCRACIEERQARGEQPNVVDLYEVDPAAVKKLFAEINAGQQMLHHIPTPDYYEDDDEVEIEDDKANTSF